VGLLQIVVLAVGLAMDATAVAAARGCVMQRVRLAAGLQISLLFGAAQAIMPALGWLLGKQAGSFLEDYDHWFAFVVLGVLGLKMLHESLKEAEPEAAPNVGGLFTLLALALATSVDAFAVGITLPLLDAPFTLTIVVIGLVTFVLSAAGVLLGRRFGSMLGRKFDAFGGVVLILLGVKILVEHLTA
jgi:putative Mn2+ efflux pump MntP